MAETWQKAVASALIAYFGMSWLDQKILLGSDVSLAMRMSKMLAMSRTMAEKYHTVTDGWYETLSKVDRNKKSLVNATTGEALTFDEVEKRSNQVGWVHGCVRRVERVMVVGDEAFWGRSSFSDAAAGSVWGAVAAARTDFSTRLPHPPAPCLATRRM
jgi:hypothetical protein